MISRKLQLVLLAFFLTVFAAKAQTATDNYSEAQRQHLKQLQQQFVDLRFGMFIHFNIPTYMDADWPDPEASPALFNPTKLDCNQWAKAAKAAHMTYGCLTTKHHSGFCIWDTKSTDYNVMNSPLKRDVVKEYVEAFRANGLKVMLYYSILDTHHKLRPNQIQLSHIEMVKTQLTELLTKYGKIEALIIDGWDAPWSRISYDDVPFEDIYHLVKKLQPDCLLMDLNGAKYPGQGLYYTDIKTYEMGAGQRMQKESNFMPSLACLPIQSAWFWKTDFPTTPVKDAAKLVNEQLIKLNNDRCNFILNVAPNRDGLFDANALAGLDAIGKLWKNEGPVAPIGDIDLPIISSNLAKNQPANSSWSDDSNISDFANDDNFGSSWISNPVVKQPWYEISFKRETALNTIVIAEEKANINKYKLEYYSAGSWKPILDGDKAGKIKLHRFNRIWANKVRMQIIGYKEQPSIAEFEVYNEQR
ncbi:carbohydrate-binding protein [Mucilaginibacter corticis]|uniref:alpha-L-fucosidase n=1 Tax=Mucilaginibacter corticis TaxID=2597670 RepID=A0A556MII8_9SPHI|nr:alpha-L-fucosidase [Mucilaginibacter corticis]TSJ39635.1 carbohydrate-binding protein [Mucilaginibacter corticis]